MNSADLESWEETTNTVAEPQQRGEDYDRFKKEKAEKMIEFMYEVLPEVEGNIQAVYTSSPLSYRDYIGSPHGSMYGILNDCNQPLATMLNPSTRIEGLYLTGQNLNLHGLLGVSMSALKTCGELLGLDYILEKVNQH
jgi:phytoene dehydrogenase-like protein